MRARIAGLSIVATLVTAGGCAGTLDDPARFLDDDAGTAGSADNAGDAGDEGPAETTDAGATSTPGTDASCPNIPQLFAATCTASSCHSSSNKAQGLDLQSPGLAARLVGVPATEGPGALINPSAPSQSIIYVKLQPNPAFGARMPLGAAPLDSATIACVLAWITQVATAQGDAAGSPDAPAGNAADEDAGGGTGSSDGAAE